MDLKFLIDIIWILFLNIYLKVIGFGGLFLGFYYLGKLSGWIVKIGGLVL